MRCLACNRVLEDFEATRKYQGTDKFVDLCNTCFKTIKDDIKVTERNDLLTESDTLEEAYEDDYRFIEYEK